MRGLINHGEPLFHPDQRTKCCTWWIASISKWMRSELILTSHKHKAAATLTALWDTLWAQNGLQNCSDSSFRRANVTTSITGLGTVIICTKDCVHSPWMCHLHSPSLFPPAPLSTHPDRSRQAAGSAGGFPPQVLRVFGWRCCLLMFLQIVALHSASVVINQQWDVGPFGERSSGRVAEWFCSCYMVQLSCPGSLDVSSLLDSETIWRVSAKIDPLSGCASCTQS